MAPFAASALLVGCGGGDGATAKTDLAAAPTNVRWEPYQGVQLPNADQGPSEFDTGAALGFARKPAGAALAAAVHTVRVSVAPDNQWARIVSLEVVPDKARDDFATSRVQLSITGPGNPQYRPRLRGYRVTQYTDDLACVDVYTSYSDNSLAANHVKVAWTNNDWRLRLPDGSSTRKPVDSIGELPHDMVKLEAPAT